MTVHYFDRIELDVGATPLSVAMMVETAIGAVEKSTLPIGRNAALTLAAVYLIRRMADADAEATEDLLRAAADMIELGRDGPQAEQIDRKHTEREILRARMAIIASLSQQERAATEEGRGEGDHG